MVLLQTKTNCPSSHPQWISRQRLLEDLLLTPKTGLVLFCAPAGFGKTTFVTEWIHRYPELHPNHAPSVCWLALDEGDNDPARFFAYLAATLSQAAGNSALWVAVLERFSQASPESTRSGLNMILNLLQQAQREVLLVLDDYQSIQNADIHSAVAHLLEKRPENFHLVITTRAMPTALPLYRLRVRGQLIEVRQKELSFSEAESREFITKVTGCELPPEQWAAIQARCEGWPAGLHLAALLLREKKDAGRSFASITGRWRPVFQYLLNEVFITLPENQQTFLSRTSILSRLNPALCAALLDISEEDASNILETLEDQNLFTVALDDSGTWYRYHPLFAEMLAERLKKTTPALIPELHRRAGDWLHAHHLTSEAIQHGLSIPDLPCAAGWIEQEADILLARGENQTLTGWLSAIPAEILQAHPKLMAVQAWLWAFAGERIKALTLIPFPAHPDNKNSAPCGEIAAVWAFLSLRQLPPASIIACSLAALEQLAETALFWRGVAARCLAEGYLYNGQPDSAAESLEQAESISLKAGYLSLGFSTACTRAGLYSSRGQLQHAAAILREALNIARSLDQTGNSSITLLYCALANVLLEWNQMEEAQSYLALAQAFDESLLLPDACSSLYMTQYRFFLTQKEVPEANAAIEKVKVLFLRSLPIEAIPATDDHSLSRIFESYQMRAALSAGQIEVAKKWADRLVTAGEVQLDTPPALQEAPYFLPVVLAFIPRTVQNRVTPTLIRLEKFLKNLCQMPELRNVYPANLELLSTLAVVLAMQKREAEALQPLAQALDLGLAGNYIRCFVDLGLPLAPLLNLLIVQEPGSPRALYAARLRQAFEPVSGEPIAVTSHRLPPEAERLSERELEIIRLVASGCSNQVIAERLSISLPTVKSHLNHIMNKLAAQNRTEAVARARDQGWI